MNRLSSRQKGASAIGNIIFLVALGFAVYLGIQYAPQAIESKSIDSILKTLENTQRTNPATTVMDARAKLINLLQINEMNDMADNFSVEKSDGAIVITCSYDRELNLIYKKQPIKYRKKLRLQYR
jgi:hypothetical protein